MLKEKLRQIALFRDLENSDLEHLAEHFMPLAVSEGEIIFREGDPPTAFYIIVEGQIALFRDAVGKPVQLLTRLQAGDFFGEMGLFEDAHRAASAQASLPCQLMRIGRDALLSFLEDQPILTLRLQMAAARRHSANVAAALELGQRKVLRIKIDQQVLLTPESGNKRLVVLENLSPVGLCMSRAPSEWQPEAMVRFRLTKGWDELALMGRIAWRRGDAVGIAFTQRTAEQDAKVQATLRKMLGQP